MRRTSSAFYGAIQSTPPRVPFAPKNDAPRAKIPLEH
jgi:hypothetical protein